MDRRADSDLHRGLLPAVCAAALLLSAPAPSTGEARPTVPGVGAADDPADPGTETTWLEARRGEGIWHLLRRGGLAPTPEAIRRFKELNRDRLLPDDGLMVGTSYELPDGASGEASGRAAPGVSVHPIFGPAHERVKVKSDRLRGHVYYIMSGHGGPDPGTIGRPGGRTLPEDEVAYDVALRLARRLLEEGATPYLIVKDHDDGIRDDAWFRHDEDERYLDGSRIARSQRRRLRDRVRIVDRLYEEHRGSAASQRLLSLHVDARGGRREPQIDVHFLVASRSGSRFATTLRSTFRARYAVVQPGRGYRGSVAYRNLYVLRRTRPVATVVELGNIRNHRDQMRLTRAENRQALAEWLVQGILRDAG